MEKTNIRKLIRGLFPNRHVKELHALLLMLASSLVGYSAWGKDGCIAISLIFPIAWGLAGSRKEAALIAAAYYLTASRGLPPAAAVFFGEETSLITGLLMWLAAAGINSAPWIALWAPFTNRPARSIFIRTTAILAIGVLPPVALIGWTSPLLASATLFPGLGIMAFPLGGVAILILIYLVSTNQTRALVLAVPAVAALAIYSNTVPLQPTPTGWESINLSAGPYPITTKEKFERNKILLFRSIESIDRGAQVIVFPEQIAGWWGDHSTKSMLSEAIRIQPKTSDVTIIFGASVGIQDTPATTNSMIFMSKKGLGKLDARQSVPIALWKPWSDASTPSDWTRTGVVTIGGIKTLFSVCYEDYIPILSVISFLVEDPKLIVSVRNAWWVGDTNLLDIQDQHIAAIAKIYGVPLMRSVNRGLKSS
jgi:hypothetical protein